MVAISAVLYLVALLGILFGLVIVVRPLTAIGVRSRKPGGIVLAGSLLMLAFAMSLAPLDELFGRRDGGGSSTSTLPLGGGPPTSADTSTAGPPVLLFVLGINTEWECGEWQSEVRDLWEELGSDSSLLSRDVEVHVFSYSGNYPNGCRPDGETSAHAGSSFAVYQGGATCEAIGGPGGRARRSRAG